MNAERALWVEVICQQVRDLCSSNTADARAAEDWIGTRPSGHFSAVCTLADLDPEAAHRWLRLLVDAPREARGVQGITHSAEARDQKRRGVAAWAM